jgi:hypothetical protein
VAQHRVSLRNANAIAMLWMSRYEDVKAYEKMGLSRNTINTIVLDVYGRTLKHLCLQIVRSKKLTVLIDGTTDIKQRSPLAIQMTGIDPENGEEKWFFFFSNKTKNFVSGITQSQCTRSERKKVH